MKFAATAQSPYGIKCDCLVEFVNKNGINAIAKDTPTAVTQAINHLRQQGDLSESAHARMVYPEGEASAKRILVVPVEFELKANSPAHTTGKHLSGIANTIAKAISDYPIKDLVIHFDDRFMHSAPLSDQDGVRDAQVFTAALLNAVYKSDAFKGKETQDKNKKKLKSLPGLAKVTLATQDAELKDVKQGLVQGEAVGLGMITARNLGDAPPNICNPQYFTAEAKKLAKKHPKLTVKVLGEKELKALGAGAYLAVTQGSANPPQLITMEYKGGKASDKPICFVGKGLTFDSGGISIKPGAGMDEMKYDMCGAGSVMAVMQAAAELKLPINIVGAIAAAENMPASNATRPGDIVTTMSGQTVEILNTDAEGRLVLCDTLTYVQDKFKPQVVINMATLTGACIVALGHHTAAVMGNTPELTQELQELSLKVNDPIWELPLWSEYTDDLKSPFADIPNIAGGRGAGTIIAGCYLQKFIKDVPWAHLDIAGVAWNSGAAKGATGRPVHLLMQYLFKQLDTKPASDKAAGPAVRKRKPTARKTTVKK
ncbi:MAG TPA: leucyl aminopeptidase [Gammaproteobacteria bacterium]|nr:leucyl aminopeptidase [Gammaproteobacteria bacterium]